MINQNEVNCHLIAKVVFCGGHSSSMEIRKFCVNDKDYQQFVTLVSDSLHQQCVDTDDFKLMYLDSEHDWVTFSSDHEWNEAKQLYRSSESTSSKVMMKVKVIVQDGDNMKQHCSINLRGKKRRSGSSSSSKSATNSTTRPDKQHLTVGYSFEEFRKQMEAMSQIASTPSTTTTAVSEEQESKKRKQKKRPSSSTRKTSRKTRKTNESSEVPSTISSCSSSDEEFFSMTSSMDGDSSVVEAC